MTPSGSTNNDQLLKAINSLTTAVNNISKMMSSHPTGGRRGGTPYRGGTSTGNGGINGDNTARRKRSVDDEYHRNRRSHSLRSKSSTLLYNGFSKLNDEVAKLRKSYKTQYEDLDIAHKKQNEYVKAILESSKVTSKIQHGFQKQVDTILKASKSMQHIKFQGTTPGARMKEVVNMQESAQGVIAQSNKLKADRKVGSVTQLASGDVKSLAKSMADSGFSIEGMDLDKFNQRLDNHDHHIRQKKREIAHAKKHKFDPARIKKMQDELGGLKTNKAKFLERTIGKTSSTLEDFNTKITNGAKAQYQAGVASEIVEKQFDKLNFSTLGVIGAFMKAGEILLGYAKYVREIAGQQIGGLSTTIAMSSLLIGSSTAAYVKTMKQNMAQVSQLGLGGWDKAISANMRVMNSMGLFGDEAVETFGDITQSLLNIGIHPKDQKRFNAAVSDYAENAKTMSAALGVSVKDYIALNNQLSTSADGQDVMMRLDKTERAQKMQSINVERDRLAAMSSNVAAAQKFTEAMLKQGNGKFVDRQRDAMDILQFSSVLGMGDAGQRAAAIAGKHESQRTDTEKQFLNDFMLEMGKRAEQAKGLGPGNEMMVDKLQEIMPRIAGTMKEGAQVKMSAENRGSVTDEQKASMAQQAQLGEGWQAAISSVNFWQNAITNPIVKVITGLTGVVLAYIAWKNKDQILDFFKKGGIDKIKNAGSSGIDKIKNLVSGGSKAAGEAAEAASTAATTASRAASTAAEAATATSGVAGAASAGGAAAGGASITSKLAGAAKVAGKWAGIAGAIFDAGDGIMDLANGKRQDSMPSGWDMLSPMRWGMYGGEKINQGMEWMLGDSLGSKIYDWTHGDPTAAVATPAQTPGSRLSVGKISPAADDTKNASDKAINKPDAVEPTVEEKKKDPLQTLIDTVSTGAETEQTKMDEMIALLKTLIETVAPDKNGLLDALRSDGKISFNTLPDKRSLLASH